MPVYEYHCTDCQNDFEALLFNSSEEQTLKCPCCSSSALQRMMSCISGVRGSGGKSDSTCGASSSSFG
jgi:putative FmdB family regulatory protein